MFDAASCFSDWDTEKCKLFSTPWTSAVQLCPHDPAACLLERKPRRRSTSSSSSSSRSMNCLRGSWGVGKRFTRTALTHSSGADADFGNECWLFKDFHARWMRVVMWILVKIAEESDPKKDSVWGSMEYICSQEMQLKKTQLGEAVGKRLESEYRGRRLVSS